MKGNADVNKALDYTQRWVTTLFRRARKPPPPAWT
jgi:hypothetical protein